MNQSILSLNLVAQSIHIGSQSSHRKILKFSSKNNHFSSFLKASTYGICDWISQNQKHTHTHIHMSNAFCKIENRKSCDLDAIFLNANMQYLCILYVCNNNNCIYNYSCITLNVECCIKPKPHSHINHTMK